MPSRFDRTFVLQHGLHVLTLSQAVSGLYRNPEGVVRHVRAALRPHQGGAEVVAEMTRQQATEVRDYLTTLLEMWDAPLAEGDALTYYGEAHA